MNVLVSQCHTSNLRAAAPAADPGSKYGGLATFGYLLKQGNLGTNLRNISIAPCESYLTNIISKNGTRTSLAHHGPAKGC